MHTTDHLPFQQALKPSDGVGQEFIRHSSAQQTDTDVIIVEAIRSQYPQLHLTTCQVYSCDLLRYAAAGKASSTPAEEDDAVSASLKWRKYIPPAQRTDQSAGILVDSIFFGKYTYNWRDEIYLLYIVKGYPSTYNNYILSSSEESANALIRAASQYQLDLHNELLIFDGGYWHKSPELWQSVQKSSWDDVILDADKKKAIIGDVERFFNSKEKYKGFKVPWKRGVIYYGPPGNGKTISIKAIMHSLSDRPDPIPSLYVRSLASYGGAEYAISQIFSKARQFAPCFLIFEDLDSIITDGVRSYFLNEVDGLQSNDGILMVGSTNHLDRLDPGIAKRPSRFDRKYLFSEPNMQQRIQYCEFWRSKLADNKDIEFPVQISKATAAITKDFSFAYLQEVFLAAFLAIAAEEDEIDQDTTLFEDIYQFKALVAQEGISQEEDIDLDQYILWKQIKTQVKILREEMGE